MSNDTTVDATPASAVTGADLPGLDWLDLCVIGYVALPLVIFLAGWCTPCVSAISLGCVGFALKPLMWSKSNRLAPEVSVGLILLCFAAAAPWVYVSGIGHFRYANNDWLIRDVVLRDLVVSSWPVGYGLHEGQETLLRTTLAYFLPTALLSKALGLQASQPSLMVWTVLGSGLFLLQVEQHWFPGGRARP